MNTINGKSNYITCHTKRKLKAFNLVYNSILFVKLPKNLFLVTRLKKTLDLYLRF